MLEVVNNLSKRENASSMVLLPSTLATTWLSIGVSPRLFQQPSAWSLSSTFPVKQPTLYNVVGINYPLKNGIISFSCLKTSSGKMSKNIPYLLQSNANPVLWHLDIVMG